MSFNTREYIPPGAVAEAFLRDDSPVRWITGPIGSGKTNVCFFDGLRHAAQMPICTDGIRRWKGFTFRDTYTKLWDTVIKSWWDWFPETMGEWRGARGRQATHKLRLRLPDAVLELEMEFRALDEQTGDIESALKGLEGSWAYLNEGDTLSEDVLTNILGRVLQRRYPPHRLLPASAFTRDEKGERIPTYFAGVIGDMNPPDVDNYTYELFEERKPDGYKIFKQPGGRSPGGENRRGVTLQSYHQLAALNKHRPDWVRRMVDGLYGYSRDGLPVYIEYDDQRHAAEEDLKPIPGLPLRLGFDQGVMGPAMVVGQFTYAGQLRVLDELTPGKRTGPTAFGKQCRALLGERYAGFEIISATCDLAGFSGGDKEEGDHAWAEIVSEALGLMLLPAPTNELDARLDVVKQMLTYFIDGRDPALLLSPRCRVLRKGFNSHYKYELIGSGKNAVPAPKPQKNKFSNPHDALQYMALDIFGLSNVIKGVPGKGTRIKAQHVIDDDDEAVPTSRDFDVFNT